MEFPGFTSIHLNEVDSTNSYLSEHFSSLNHHHLVYSDIQLAGRGRLSRTWDSSHQGNIYASLLIKSADLILRFPASNWTQLMALAVLRALRQYEIKAGIKWPNDIFAHHACHLDSAEMDLAERHQMDEPPAMVKLGGILSEARYIGSRPAGIIIGFGINVVAAPQLNPRFEMAKQSDDQGGGSFIEYAAGSIHQLSQARPQREDVLSAILQQYSLLLSDFSTGGFPSIRDEYIDSLIFTDKPLSIEQDGFSSAYEYAGINDHGELLVRPIDERSVDPAFDADFTNTLPDPIRVVSGDVTWIPS